jgi:hypothetical protein
LPKKEKLHAAHDDCEKNKSYPNVVEQHIGRKGTKNLRNLQIFLLRVESFVFPSDIFA